MQTPLSLTSEEGFFIETAEQEPIVVSWEMVDARLRQRVGVILYREHSKLHDRSPLFGGWASIWQPQIDFWIEIYTDRGRTTSSEVIWMTLRDRIKLLWQRERRELILQSRKNPLAFDQQILKFLDILGFR